jgi:glyoxylase-like metal-dependent hydrolase (beta-lactamase superfamily II)/rhodanese-related sulfurtransferase
MYFQQILHEPCGCTSYLIASRQSREAVIIDPAYEIEDYERLLRERGLRLRYVIDTHVHADHVSGARRLAATHEAELCLHESAPTTYPFRPLREGEELALGQLRLRVLHTPGHRPELISLLVINPPRSPEPSMVLTGDSLLVGDVGRPDFAGGDAEAQYASLHRLLQLPDWIAVFPGHFEGPCGQDMCGRPSTTIGFERLYNPLARLDRAPFVAKLTAAVPARPLNMVAIEATNRGLAELSWAMPTFSPEVPHVDVAALAARSPGAVVLDVREPVEYARGHVPGAISLPQAELATRLDEIPHDRPLFVVCQRGSRSLRAAQFLIQTGYGEVASVAGGTDAWQQAGLPLAVDDASWPMPDGAEAPGREALECARDTIFAHCSPHQAWTGRGRL